MRRELPTNISKRRKLALSSSLTQSIPISIKSNKCIKNKNNNGNDFAIPNIIASMSKW